MVGSLRTFSFLQFCQSLKCGTYCLVHVCLAIYARNISQMFLLLGQNIFLKQFTHQIGTICKDIILHILCKNH